jgi:hypothetical protein
VIGRNRVVKESASKTACNTSSLLRKSAVDAALGFDVEEEDEEEEVVSFLLAVTEVEASLSSMREARRDLDMV